MPCIHALKQDTTSNIQLSRFEQFAWSLKFHKSFDCPTKAHAEIANPTASRPISYTVKYFLKNASPMIHKSPPGTLRSIP